MSDAANCICIHGYVSTCPLHGGKTLPNASPPSWKKPPFTECELTITLSEHAAQLQAACVELREKAADTARKCVHWYEGHGDAVGDCAADEILVIPIPTAALETAIAEARLSEAKTQHDHFFAIDTGYTMHECHPAAYSCIRLSEAQAALDAAKAKERT